MAGVAHSVFRHLDLEGTATAQLYIENTAQCVFEELEVGTATSHIVARKARFSAIRCYKEINTDFDSATAAELIYEGAVQLHRRSRGNGFWRDAAQARSGVNVVGTGTDAGFDFASLFLTGGAVVQANRALTLKTNAQAGGVISLDAGRAGLIPCSAGVDSAWTLPTIINATPQTSNVGLNFYIPNSGGKKLVLNTDGTQTFNGQTGKTQLIVPPGEAVFVVANQSLQWNVFGSALVDVIQVKRPAYNPGNLATRAQLTLDVTVTGAAFGDFVGVSASIDLAGVLAIAQVSAANTVRVTYINLSGAPIDLPAHDIWLRVKKKGVNE